MLDLDFNNSIQNFLESETDIVIVTLYNIKGSAPQNIGAKMIVSSSGVEYGTVGGGKVEKSAIEFSQSLLSEKKNNPQIKKWNLQKDIGMTCGGEVELFFDPIIHSNKWEIAIFGAGHVSQALVRILQTLDLKMKVIETRRKWLDKIPNHSKIEKVHCEKLEDEVFKLSPKSFVISITMGHAFDVPVLEQAFKRGDFPYIGVIGSKSKRNQIVKDLLELGTSKEKVDSLVCPLGEKIGSNRPEEIAISICAQLLKKRDELF